MSQQQIHNTNCGHTLAPVFVRGQGPILGRSNYGHTLVTAQSHLGRSNYGHTNFHSCLRGGERSEAHPRPLVWLVPSVHSQPQKAFQKRRKIKKVLRSLGAGFNAVTLPWPHRQKNQGNLKAPPRDHDSQKNLIV